MKIALVLDDSLDKPDGVQQYVLTLGSWLTSQKHEVHYLVGATSRKDIPNVHSLSANMRVRFNKNRASMPMIANRKAIRALTEKEKFDVLHVQMPYSPLLAGKIIDYISSGTALVGTFHIFPYGGLQFNFTKDLGLLTRRTLARLDLVMSTSTAAQNFAEKSYKIKSVVMPNPVDLQKFKPARNIKKQDEKINIVFLGRLVERKGAMQLLKAVNVLPDEDKERIK